MADHLAHSARNGHKAQTYSDHIGNVHKLAVAFAKEAEAYAAGGGDQLERCVHNAALLHDLGKLDPANQKALCREDNQRHLPVNHVDAGAACLLAQHNDFYAAAVVYAHHRGLPDIQKETMRTTPFRDSDKDVCSKTDEQLAALSSLHASLVDIPLRPAAVCPGDPAVFMRLALSCLADADHSDTATVYGQQPVYTPLPGLLPEKRLAALDAYVQALGSADERSRLRHQMYESCKTAEISSGFAACDSPVGSGKTTAVMAHLLAQAVKRGSRRIFVVLPYTNIIAQAVEVYRKALVLPGEEPETIVAELHSRAEFDDADVRHLTSLWRSPIIVTTAVAFFETLASCKPSALRKLHELPGSIMFVDEAHAALPLHLLPLAWHWMDVLAREWRCYWILASGSLVRYWRIQELIQDAPAVPDLVSPQLRKQLLAYEKNRIHFRWEAKPLSPVELLELVTSAPGPRLLILNTVQNAAVLADKLRDLHGRNRVEHLSTALTPHDRSATIKRIKERLAKKTDTDWTLVATSCVEAGVDFSFKTGFREAASLVSLLQAAGRINRHGTETDAEMWTFSLQDSSQLNRNPAHKVSTSILTGYLANRTPITPELCTAAMQLELTLDDHRLRNIGALTESDLDGSFPTVCEQFRVIDEQTVTAVADMALVEQIRCAGGSWQQLQQHSVSIRASKAKAWGLQQLAEGLYAWTLPYDPFLGYMSGVLSLPYGSGR